MTYVCITGNEQSQQTLLERIERVLSSHQRLLCELRLDYLDLSPAAAFGFLARIPNDWATRLVITQRLRASGPEAGGQCAWDILTWQSWWRDVMALKPWFAADIDWLVLDRLAGESLEWRGQFRSRHAFFSLHAPLAEIEQQLPSMVAAAKEAGAGVKIAAPVRGARDLAKLAELSQSLSELSFKAVVGMGAAGRAQRWSGLCGNLTYFAAEPKKITAPGQDSWADVLPYLQNRRRPGLFLLLGDDPENLFGENRWNKIFLQRGAKFRYVNCPQADEPGAAWGENILHWATQAGIRGASVTKPFKVSFPSPTNTLKRVESSWQRFNTDGEAVATLLHQMAVGAGEKIVIAGGGGAGQSVAEILEKKGYSVKIWSREKETLPAWPGGSILVSTWPLAHQENLLLPQGQLRLVIDASLQEGKLAEWCKKERVRYVPGTRWWVEQARLQDEIWFGLDRLGKVRDEIFSLVPTSKSEALRALAIAASCGVISAIHGLAENDDTKFFASALENLGFFLDGNHTITRVFPPKEMRAPDKEIYMGEGATGLRILAALSVHMQGENLLLSASPELMVRPMDELAEAFGFPRATWPLRIPTGSALPERISTERSSQFASAILIAAAGSLYREKIASYRLELSGELRSSPYLQLTLRMLESAGFRTSWEGKNISLELGEKKTAFSFVLEKDASSLAFVEVATDYLRLASFFPSLSQGDGEFPQFLVRLKEEKSLSLRDHPDLAPPLWAAAALHRLRIEITHCPQLRWKESDRAKLLVEAALKMGAKAELKEDGFVADFRGWFPPEGELVLSTQGDHRMGMAFSLLGLEGMQVFPDDIQCVKKSFPRFMEVMALLKNSTHS